MFDDASKHGLLLAVALLPACLTSAAVSDRPPHAPNKVTCAVVAADMLALPESPLVTLLDATLADSAALTVLNRLDIQKVLAEQRLDLAMTGSTRESRRSWGRILRAELLVLLEARSTTKGNIIQVQIVHTVTGLRLADNSFLLDDRVERISELIARQIEQAARGILSGFECVFAVPPFQSGDLIYDFGHLKKAYARLAQATLSARPGIVVVEFEHARQIAQELKLSRGDPALSRSQPFYVQGRFQNHGAAEARTVDVHLALLRGAVELDSKSQEGLDPKQVEVFIKSTVSRFAAEVLGSDARVEPVENAQQLEADLLTEQVEAFRRTGEWMEIVELAETCLLLDPERVEMHHHIFEASTNLVAFADRSEDMGPIFGDPVLAHSGDVSLSQRRHYALLGLEHYKQSLQHLGAQKEDHYLLSQFCFMTCFSRCNGCWDERPEGLRTFVRTLGKAKMDAVVATLEKGPIRPIFRKLAFSGRCSIDPSGPFTPAEVYDAVHSIVLALDLYESGLSSQVRVLADLWRNAMWEYKSDPHAAADFDAFLGRLESDSTGHARNAVKLTRALIAAREGGDRTKALAHLTLLSESMALPDWGRPLLIDLFKKQLDISDGESEPSLGEKSCFSIGDLRFTPLELYHLDGTAAELDWRFSRWYNSANTLDVIVNTDNVFVLGDGAVLHPCLPDQIPRKKRSFGMPVSDGRYLWIDQRADDNQVWVVDLATMELITVFGVDDGLPPTTMGCKLTPLQPGHVCAVGAFGRTWIGTLSIQEESPGHFAKAVDVFFTARRVTETLEGPYEAGPEYAFHPGQVVTVPGSETKGGPFVLVKRYNHLAYHFAVPLIVSPSARSVSIGTIPLDSTWHVVGDRLLLGPMRRMPNQTDRVCAWADAPHFEPMPIESTRLPSDSSGGYAKGVLHSVYANGFLHMIGKRWVTIDVPGGTVFRDFMLPKEFQYRRVVHSSRFGLIFLGSKNRPGIAWRVEPIEKTPEERNAMP